MLSGQFTEQLNLRKQLGGLIAENHRLYPRPPEFAGGNQGRPGMLASGTIEQQNQLLKEKIASTQVSNAIGRGERPPTGERFG